MRHVLHATLVLGCSLLVLGCAHATQAEGLTGGSGGAGPGGGGSGGSGACSPEVCDGADNDCDGEVDEGCECAVGETQPCYSGPPGTEGVGLCKAGVRPCDPYTHTFGPCTGDVVPAAAEVCDGQDEDCDGRPDDGFGDLTCGVGACAATVAACVGGVPGVCVPGLPSQEVCDGVDNDCDQLVDETFPDAGAACDTGMPGLCAAGQLRCALAFVTCLRTVEPRDEECDGADNDCDGEVDNVAGAGSDCTTGEPGVCSAGKLACQGGSLECLSAVAPSAEECDGLDNDCDGAIDDGDPGGGAPCDTGQLGACAQGTTACSGGAVVCLPDKLAQPEVCDGADNDCDGLVDEDGPDPGHVCSCGGTPACASGALVCQGCTREVVCNDGADEDADGATDCGDSQCALGCTAAVPPCPAGQTLLVLASEDVPLPIPDSSAVSSLIAVGQTGIVRRVVVQIDVTHTWDTDLDISLRSPDGTAVNLSSDNGSSGDDYTATIFHDGCATPITAGAAPFNGCYSPEQPLQKLRNLPVHGTWTLRIADDASGDTGDLHAFRLALCVE